MTGWAIVAWPVGALCDACVVHGRWAVTAGLGRDGDLAVSDSNSLNPPELTGKPT
jgi:tetrahydromethanopterin S-methyltransferase subunit E